VEQYVLRERSVPAEFARAGSLSRHNALRASWHRGKCWSATWPLRSN